MADPGMQQLGFENVEHNAYLRGGFSALYTKWKVIFAEWIRIAKKGKMCTREKIYESKSMVAILAVWTSGVGGSNLIVNYHSFCGKMNDEMTQCINRTGNR